MNRDDYFDNVKGALITLVVIGHFLIPMDRTRLVQGLMNIIYLFHMPMFAMISGYFAKGIYRNGRFRTDKVLRLAWFYIVFKILVHVTENLAAGAPVTGLIDFYREEGAPWYLMAMIWWYLSVPCMAGLKPKAVFMICLCLGLTGGYQRSVEDILVISRTLTFAPFFYAGYYWKREQTEKFRNSTRRWFFVAAAIGIAGAVAFGGSYFDRIRVIIYGANYWRLAPELYSWGALIRGSIYICGMVMILGMMAVIPKKRMWWTFLGERTLQVYILHRLLRDMMQYWGFYEMVTSQYRRNVGLVILMAAGTALTLANPWFTWIFAQLQKVPDGFYHRWKQR